MTVIVLANEDNYEFVTYDANMSVNAGRLAGVLWADVAGWEQVNSTEDCRDSADCIAMGARPANSCQPTAVRGVSAICAVPAFDYCHRFTAVMQVNMCQLAPPVKNWRILLL